MIKIFEIMCDFLDDYLMGYVKWVGLVGEEILFEML